MAPFGTEDRATAAGEPAGPPRGGRRKVARYAVPATVVGVAAATIGIVPALASSGDPDLPAISAQQLIEKIAASDVQQFSGTVRVNTDLGLPDLGGLAGGLGGGAAGGGDGSSADPSAKVTELATGSHTLRVAADGPDRQKVSVLEDAAEYSLIHHGKDVWGYDSKSNEVFHTTADDAGRSAPGKDEQGKDKQGKDGHGKGERGAENFTGTPKDFAEQALKAAGPTTSVTVDGTAQVAGRDAYKLVIKPKQSGTTVGAISIAVDAGTGVPLKFTLTPKSGGAAVVDVGFTQVSFAKPAASTFDFTPPKGAKVTEGGDRAHQGKGDGPLKGGLPEHLLPTPGGEPGKGPDGLKVIGEGWSAIAAFDTGAKGGMPSGSEVGGDLGGFLDSLGDKVSGKFGKGTVFSTRLVNALITDDGKVYVGAVTKDALVEAADAGK
ncbi:outer membrane lipoprotein carrier protein LolA [Streptomyces sp. NPDC014805]|uniref:LolA family protein n=1 Tax=Streptomyces sp. NPDC014805 TaxID=3364919 RepID=UPI0036F81853